MSHDDSPPEGWNADLDDRYDCLDYVGKGVFGKVFKAIKRGTGELVAIKRLYFEDDIGDGVPSHVIREVCLLKDFKHPNVVRLHEIIITHVAEYNLVFEYVDNDLHRVLGGQRRSGQCLPMDVVLKYASDLVNGIQACHLRMVIHRDLKPQNILVSEGGLKICDFGLARLYAQPLKAYTHDVVTLWYRAPEILLGTTIYGPEVDMWSAGCCLAELATCRALFPGDSEIGTIFLILRLLGTPTKESWPNFDNLEHWKPTFPVWEPTELRPVRDIRPDMPESYIDLLRALVCMNPAARLPARKAKNHPAVRDIRQEV